MIKVKKNISIILAVTLFLTEFFLFPFASDAATVIKTETKTVSFTDLAYYDVWKHEDGTWQNGIRPGSPASQAYVISESIVPKEAKIVSIAGAFNSSYNTSPYGSYCVLSANISSINYEYLPGEIKGEAAASIQYSVSTTLISRSGTNGRDIKEPWQSENVEGYKYYIPVKFEITYTIEVVTEIGDFQPDLNLPASAKQCENYTASDATIVDSSTTIDYAELEKHYGDGNWEFVGTWEGTGLPGRNTGGSRSESCDEICTITYRLTVYNTSGQSKSVTKSINITDGREIDGQAILVLSEFTYEGHPALAEDVSELEVNGTSYSARRAYEENIASNRFRPLPSGAGSASKQSLTTANVVFPIRGNYTVRLEVNTVDGKQLTDTKPIEVRKTPYIIDNLGGFQKQNRKQILNVSVATYPGKPITDYYIELTDLKTGQSITLTPVQPQQNNVTIKTRAITSNGDTYWTNFQLLFLTKNQETQEYRYKIYMKDSKGDTDTVQKNFTVVPDLPPNPSITIQDSFIRNKGTNTAEIQAEDSSTTDGDQLQRTWTVKGVNVPSLPGFKDHSFGSRQKVQYNKTGVGKETIRLFVKDVWTEPTLEEYITADDYLSATTTAAANVINIAPTVRLEPIETETADIAIVTEKASEGGIKAGINSLRAALIEAGIDANVQVIPTAKPNNDGYKNVGYYEWKIAINDPSQNSTGLIFDSGYSYVVEAAGYQIGGAGNYQEVAIPPYTVKALKKSATESGSLSVAWSYTVTESTNFRLRTDSSENYIYLAYNDLGKTVLLNRNNGAYVTTLPVIIPDNPYTTSNNSNLYFLSGNCIQKYDTDTGTLKTVINSGGTLGRVQNGTITFVGREAGYRFYIGQFDMNTETITRKAIPELEEFKFEQMGWSMSSVVPADMDTTGKVCFYQTIIDNRYYDTKGIVLWLADTDSQKVYNLGRVASPSDMRTTTLGFVKDETGKAQYMHHSFHDDDSTTSTKRKYFHLYVYTLGDGDTTPIKRTIYSQNNKRDNFNGISYAKYHSQEDAIYLMQGSEWQGYDWGGTQQGVMCRIQLPSWSVNFNQYGWGWDVADEEGRWNDYLMMTYFNYNNWVDNDRRIKMFTNSITKDQAEESALIRLADFAQDATRYIEKSFTDIQTLVDKIKAAVKEKTSLKFAVSNGGQISLSRSYQLKPGQTYYYEFEVKKPAGDDSGGTEKKKLNITAPDFAFSTNNTYVGAGNLGSYYVAQTYREDFNDSELDPFFTYVDGSINGKLTTPGTTKGSKNRDIGMSATVKFTVPAGKKAIAMMDVTGDLGGPSSQYGQQDTNGWKSGVYINGQRYDNQPKIGYDIMNYVHPYLLKEGENTIQAYCCWYGRGDDGYYISIDNLKIMFVEETSSTSANTFSSSLTEDGWTRATGSFRTPQEISEFQSQAMTHYANWPPGLATSVSANGNSTYYDFAIPAGNIAKIHATFEGYSGRDNATAGTFTFPGWSVVHIGTNSPSSYHGYVYSGNRYFSGHFQGSIRLTLTAGYQRSLGFSKLETYLYPENLKDKNSFFFTGDKVYSMSNTFDGKTDVKINLNSDGANSELLMQNFKIYYLHNGNKVYLYNKPLQDTSELSGWTITENAVTDMHTETKPEKEDDAPLVYKKGQLVSYNIFYDDYENDPSKKQYWKYTHTPYNDGPHPDAAVILDEYGNAVSSTGAILAGSIPRFYIDGKYTVEHWQEDNTNQTGDTSGETDYTLYDKLSNIESITFYVEGGATAPWITFIKTIPGTVKEGDDYRLQIGVDDAEKDELRLTTELYKDKKLIYTHRQTGIVADASGNYPLTTTGDAPLAEAGKYEVVCTVRDWTGAGIGTYKFTVVSEGKITGHVNHTDQWNINRIKYNLGKSGTTELPRRYNVFWSGERFMLRSEVAGSPSQVTAQILGYSYSTIMDNTGVKNAANETIYAGEIWNADMINKWGRKTPVTLTFRFTATYSSGTTRTDQVTVIVDDKNSYYKLHRYF